MSEKEKNKYCWNEEAKQFWNYHINIINHSCNDVYLNFIKMNKKKY